MANSLIRKDKHGLYVLTGGYLFRPVLSKWVSGGFTDYPSSIFDEGEKVPNCRHRGGTNVATIGGEDGEIWFSHYHVDSDGVTSGSIRPKPSISGSATILDCCTFCKS